MMAFKVEDVTSLPEEKRFALLASVSQGLGLPAYATEHRTASNS